MSEQVIHSKSISEIQSVMGFKEGFTMTLDELGNLLLSLSSRTVLQSTVDSQINLTIKSL